MFSVRNEENNMGVHHRTASLPLLSGELCRPHRESEKSMLFSRDPITSASAALRAAKPACGRPSQSPPAGRDPLPWPRQRSQLRTCTCASMFFSRADTSCSLLETAL